MRDLNEHILLGDMAAAAAWQLVLTAVADCNGCSLGLQSTNEPCATEQVQACCQPCPTACMTGGTDGVGEAPHGQEDRHIISSQPAWLDQKFDPTSGSFLHCLLPAPKKVELRDEAGRHTICCMGRFTLHMPGNGSHPAHSRQLDHPQVSLSIRKFVRV